ncbi:MAG: L-lactate permease [Brevinemataceae bacterium]
MIDFLTACMPIILLIILLLLLKIPNLVAVSITLLTTSIFVLLTHRITIPSLLLGILEGAVFGIWPVGIIILGSLSLANMISKTGYIKIIESGLGSISQDQRILVVIIAWGMGSFLEAIAGFGSGLALPIFVLVSIGVPAIKAALAALLSNSVPTALGGVGIPLITYQTIAGLDASEMVPVIGMQLILFSFLIPIGIAYLVSGSFKKLREIIWVPIFAGLGQTVGLMLPFGVSAAPILAGLLNLGGAIFAAKVFYNSASGTNSPSVSENCKAWFPFFLAAVLLILVSPLFPALNAFYSQFTMKALIHPEGKSLSFNLFTDAGVILILCTIIGGRIQGAKFNEIFLTIANTFKNMINTLLVLISIIAIAKIMTYSGLITEISKGIVALTGSAYPLIAPILGALGTFVTGSVTSSVLLFGRLQVDAANLLGLNTLWIAASNIAGSTAAKMLAPHSVAIVISAIKGSQEQEQQLFGFISKIALIYLILLSLIVYTGTKIFS